MTTPLQSTEVTSTPNGYHLDPLKVFDSLASGVSYTPGNDGITARSGNASALVAAGRIDIACESIPCAGVESSSKINSHSSSCVAPDTAAYSFGVRRSSKCLLPARIAGRKLALEQKAAEAFLHRRLSLSSAFQLFDFQPGLRIHVQRFQRRLVNRFNRR